MQLISNIFYTISYLLLGALPAVLIDIVSLFRCIIFYKYDKRRKKCPIFIMAFLIFLTIMIGIFTCKNIFDFIPIIISIIYIVTTWQDSINIIQTIIIAKLRLSNLFCLRHLRL